MSNPERSGSESNGSESDGSHSSGYGILEPDGETQFPTNGRSHGPNAHSHQGQLIRAGDQEHNLGIRGEPRIASLQNNTGNSEQPQHAVSIQLNAELFRRLLNSDGFRQFCLAIPIQLNEELFRRLLNSDGVRQIRQAISQQLPELVCQGVFNEFLPDICQLFGILQFLRQVRRQSNAGDVFGQYIRDHFRALVPRLNADEFDGILLQVTQEAYQFIGRKENHLPTEVTDTDSDNDQPESFNNNQSFPDLFRGGRRRLHYSPHRIIRMAYFGTIIMAIVDIMIATIIITSIIVAGIISLL